MRPFGAAAFLIAFAAALAAGVLAEQSRAPAAVTIRARLVAADSGVPIPYARVSVSNSASPFRTDVDGQFNVDARPNATLVITKSGYLRLERQVASVDSQSDIPLIRAAALSGRVVDEYGDPVVAAIVTASAPGVPRGPRLAATTDDRGEFRIGGLAPGAYRVAVQTTGLQEGPSTAVINGATGPTRVTSLQQTTTMTYFPNTTDAAGAADIVLSPGGERLDIDFHVPMARAVRQPFLLTTAIPGTIDTRPAIADGATIRGTVSDSSGRPLPFAQVTLNGNAASSSGRVLEAEALLSTFRTTPTSERGDYEFTGLRSGNYVVRAAKAGYATPTAAQSMNPLSGVRAGETYVQDVTLTPWSAVSGRVRDDFGDPVHGATVTLLQSRYERGRRRLVPVPVSPRVTNDRGEFRLFAVPPGEYIVMARAAEDGDDLIGYPPTFYPGSVFGNDARPIAVDVGSDVDGIDFALVAAATVRVSGQTFDATGKPTTQLRVSLMARNGLTAAIEARIEVDGTFDFDNVPPGQYVLRADAGRTNTFTEGPFIAMALSVGQSDVSGLRVQASGGSTITGRFVFDRSVRTSDPPPTAVTITAVPDDFDAAPAFVASTQANASGIFQLRGVTGTRRLQVTRVPPRYMVTAILVNGRDVADEPLAFGRPNQSLDDVQVVLSDRVTTLTVRVTDGRRPVGSGVHVVMFSTDPARMYPLSRYQHHQTTGADGAFTLTGIPTGSYFAVAAASIPPGDEAWRDPAYLESIIGSATIISVGEGENNTATVRLTER